MSIYLVYEHAGNGRGKIAQQYRNPFDGLPELHGPGLFFDEIPYPETPAGFSPVLMVRLPAEGSDEEPMLYYDYVAIPEPEETQLQKTQKQVAELENRTKVLEYGAQATGETLDIHEGAIVDVMTLALGGSPDDL